LTKIDKLCYTDLITPSSTAKKSANNGSNMVRMNNLEETLAKITAAQSVLVAVSAHPTPDELAAALGLTLAIGQLDKPVAAIFSGELPPIINFLHPDQVFDDSTAGLRDFIISLDKAKADRVRTKVEGDVVKIFITPHAGAITPHDLSYDAGELNVDLVIALGAKQESELDQALLTHGKVLHSAPIVTIGDSSLGTLSLSTTGLSGYTEAVTRLLKKSSDIRFDKKLATVLLTGLVLATEQFGNAKTTPEVMTLASKLLADGADQQLVVAELNTKSSAAKAPAKAEDAMVPMIVDEPPVPVVAKQDLTTMIAEAEQATVSAMQGEISVPAPTLEPAPMPAAKPSIDLTIPPAPQVPMPQTTKPTGVLPKPADATVSLPPPPPAPQFLGGMPVIESQLPPPPTVQTPPASGAAGHAPTPSDLGDFHLPS
jgi:hypothetical protein